MREPSADDTRGLAKQLNANAVSLIEQVLQKHTAAILDVIREQTHELETERARVRVLREAGERVIDATDKAKKVYGGTLSFDAVCELDKLQQALATTAPEAGEDV